MIVEHEVVHEMAPGIATGARIVFDDRHGIWRYEQLCVAGCVQQKKRTWVRAYQKRKKAEVMFRCRECGSKGLMPGTEQSMIAKHRERIHAKKK